MGDSQPKNRLPSVLALLSLRPPAKAQGWRSGVKHPEKQQPQRKEPGGIFWRWRSGMGCYRGGAEHHGGGPCLTSRFWERAVSPTFSTGAAIRAPPASLEVQGQNGATEPVPARRDAVPSRPTATAKQLSLTLVAAPAAAPLLFPSRKLSPAIPLFCGGLCSNSPCNFWFTESVFTGSKASQDSF